MKTEETAFDGFTDAGLVVQSRSGDRNAFACIVARYQSLVCSLTYSSTGNLSQSEDLAQETFFTAWRRMESLREPSKLRSWLCGIARNLISNSRFKQTREPAHHAAQIDAACQAPSQEPFGFSIGLVSVGGTAIGLFALAGLGLAIWSLAGVSVGYLAGGGCAVAWKAAFGGLAIAREFAVGGAVYAANANNAAAKAFVENNWFLNHAMTGMNGAWWLNLIWLPMLLAIWQISRARKAARSTLPPR